MTHKHAQAIVAIVIAILGCYALMTHYIPVAAAAIAGAFYLIVWKMTSKNDNVTSSK